MRDFNEHSITEAVVERFAQAPDPRLREIMQSLVRHLHDFVRDVQPTMDEWGYAIEFLTRTGHMCDDKRQEFILLSDALGVSMLVDAINHRMPEGVTESTVFGPFYVDDAKQYELGADITEGVPGTPMLITGTVSGQDGQPLAGATVNLWQSDTEGFYDVQRLDSLALRGVLHTD